MTLSPSVRWLGFDKVTEPREIATLLGLLTRPETLVSVTAVRVLKHEVLAGKLKAAEQSSVVNEMQIGTNVLV